MSEQDLRKNRMMAHLLDALGEGKDIGHYGRLVFAIVARYFLSADEVVDWLSKDPTTNEKEARGLLAQVETHEYNPPRREKIVAWQQEQDFAIIPEHEGSDAADVYDDLRFPDSVYQHIADYYQQKTEE